MKFFAYHYGDVDKRYDREVYTHKAFKHSKAECAEVGLFIKLFNQ